MFELNQIALPWQIDAIGCVERYRNDVPNFIPRMRGTLNLLAKI
jgi:hypothetical protein